MFAILAWIRHLIIIVAAVSTLYTGQIDSYSVFTILILCSLVLLRLRARAVPQLTFALFACETLFFGYLSYTYGGMMFFCMISALISLYEKQPRGQLILPIRKLVCSLLILIAMNVSMLHLPASMVFIANIVLIIIGLLLAAIDITLSQKQEAETLYGELNLNNLALEDARRRLLLYAKQVEEYAQSEERNRISKDIHDDLGHRLIRQKMMMEAALQIYEMEPDKAKAILEQVRDQMGEAMDTLRRTVRNLAPSTQASHQYSLHQLVQSAGESLGIAIDVRMLGVPYPLYPSFEYILYRNAQEAITNAIRHGQASSVTIMLTYEDRQVQMTVQNNGLVPDIDLHKGLGLRGMQERTELVGGELTWCCDEQFCITTTLPHYRLQ